MSTPTTPQDMPETQTLTQTDQDALNATLAAILTTATASRVTQQSVTLSRSERGELDATLQRIIQGKSIYDLLAQLTIDDVPALSEIELVIFPSLSQNVRKYLEWTMTDKRTSILMTDWTKTMDEIIHSVSSVVSLQDITELWETAKVHLEKRRNIAIPTWQQEGTLVRVIDDLAQKREILQKSLDTELGIRFEKWLDRLAHALAQILFSSQIASIYNDPVYTALLGLMENMSSSLRESKQKELEWEISKRSSELGTKEEAEKELKKKEQSWYIRSVRELLWRIEEAVKIQDTADGVEKIEKWWIPVQIRTILPKISSEAEREAILNEMEKIFEWKKNNLRIAITQWGYADIGDGVKLKVFVPEPPKKLRWEIKTKPPKDGMIDIYFEAKEQGKSHGDAEILWRINPHGGVENGQTSRQIYDPHYSLRVPEADFREMMKYVRKSMHKNGIWELYNVLKYDTSMPVVYANDVEKDAAEHAKKYGYLARILAKLPKENILARKRLPLLNSGSVIGPTARSVIKEFSELMEIQLTSRGEGAGIVIGESDAGAGKNYKLELYAALTNREIFEMSGNKTATRGDILFTHEIWPDGTYRASTELIKWMQTAGGIICIDEINAYPPEVAKLMNPLLTGARYINDPIRGKIYCDPTVIICGFMNPGTYIGTNSLAQEMRSRARIYKDRYPDLDLPGGKWLSWEEWLIMAKHAKKTGLSKMKQDDFINDWLALNAAQPPRQVLPNQFWGSLEAQNEVVLIRRYLKFVHKMRELHRLTAESQSADDQEFSYSIWIRESIQIMYEFERIHDTTSNDSVSDFRKAIWAVVAPKLSMKWINVDQEKALLVKQIDAFIV